MSMTNEMSDATANAEGFQKNLPYAASEAAKEVKQDLQTTLDTMSELTSRIIPKHGDVSEDCHATNILNHMLALGHAINGLEAEDMVPLSELEQDDLEQMQHARSDLRELSKHYA